MGALGASMDTRGVVRADSGRRHGILVVLLHTRLGRLLGVGSGGKRILHAMAGRNGAVAFLHRRRKARHLEILDDLSGDHHIFLVAAWNVPCAFRHPDIGAQLRQRSARGIYIISLLGTFTGASLILYAIRAPALKGGGLFTPVSREGGLLFNNLILSTAAGTVLLGTLYPLFVDALHLGKVSVGPPYFNTVIVPLMVPLFVLMAVGPMLSWKRGDFLGAVAKLKFAFVAMAVTVVATLLIAGHAQRSLWAALGLGLAAWLFFGALSEWMGRVGLFQGFIPKAPSIAQCICRAPPMA